MSETVKLNVGSIDDMGKRFIGAWHSLEQGEEVKETNLTFFNWGDQRPKVATLGCVTYRRFSRGIWGVIHGSHSCRQG